jgi:hypothetical protein
MPGANALRLQIARTLARPLPSLAPIEQKRNAVRHVFAVEYIRRMRGDSQSQLLRCSNGEYYVVKFQNNPQGIRILANELLGTLLARRLGIPVPDPAIVDVSDSLIRSTGEMIVELRKGRVACRAGLCFGSRYPQQEDDRGDPHLPPVYNHLPNEHIQQVENLSAFIGLLVFHKWTCNTDGPQAVFIRQGIRSSYRALMIDQGYCFNGEHWNFPDAPLYGLYSNRAVYAGLRTFDAFDPWLNCLENQIDEKDLGAAAAEIPPEWYENDLVALCRLLDRLNRRRMIVRRLLHSLLETLAEPLGK